MGDQRRRGRGRSGRGGRIPRRGEGGGGSLASDESFVSFPLDAGGPIQVTSGIDPEAVAALLHDTLEQERSQAEAFQALAQDGDPVLGELRLQIERHRDMLQQLARDLGADTSGGERGEGDAEPRTLRDVALEQRRVRMGWLALQRAAYGTGDRRIDRVVRPVLREKDRHAAVLETLAVRRGTERLFRPLDD